MPYCPLPTGDGHSETCPQLGYMGYKLGLKRLRLNRLTPYNPSLSVGPALGQLKFRSK